MRSKIISVIALLSAAALVVVPTFPALADHTNPRERQAAVRGAPQEQGLETGEGTWGYIRNFPPNPGSDLFFFKKKRKLYATSGTLGQANEEHVGQRIIQLVGRSGRVNVRWVADHASAKCPTANPSGTTGLQHDVQATPKRQPKLLIDATDATGRCHDPSGGGLELIDVSRLDRKKFKPREVHLTRHEGTSHNVTVDTNRPWIVYNSTSDATARPWIDVLNIKSCLGKGTVKRKRARCRPKVYRIMFQPEWAQRIDANGDRVEGTESACHDIHSTKDGRLYCANLNSTIILDVKGLTRANGDVKGERLKCEVIDGTLTAAKVTDCSQPQTGSIPQARGWRYIGHVNHAGRNLNNLQTEYTVRESISVSHEAEPTPNRKWMFVTDERGGGVVPGGASCGPEEENPYGNGGVHVFDITNQPNLEYAKTPDGDNAIFIGDAVVPGPDFCTAHVMGQVPGEQRFFIAWYSQGVKVVDYFIDGNGRWTFRETASLVLPSANTWTSLPFKIKRNPNGTKTYFLMSSDITRGIDIVKWTGPTNPNGTPPPAPGDLQRFNVGN